MMNENRTCKGSRSGMVYGNNGEKKYAKSATLTLEERVKGRRDFSNMHECPSDNDMDQGVQYILVSA